MGTSLPPMAYTGGGQLRAITHINKRRALLYRLQLYFSFFAQKKLLQVIIIFWTFALFSSHRI